MLQMTLCVCVLDKCDSIILIFFNLSAVFETVFHQLLLSRLANRVGLARQVLVWAVSRYQVVSGAGSSSEPRLLACGVPQGSVLGPIFCKITC